ncbi:GNAT family acetyltransferase [Primorskyibacter flagellatus]|uniref:GNAT family acetyltransferase n=1 Tax=Primorskyibacter flagellatus TaxID=1387277 RepID=A0A917EFY4_9RHOB|nr:GNAT family N-acetyltransferase [Primorskyibacter flagellatus]GGE38100.1 GNAT family acetyltransferase [Primorskyibacter flagellatus]
MIVAAPSFPVIETERLRLVSPAGPDFDAQETFLMPGAPQFLDHHPDEEATWWSIATIIGHWHLRGYGLFAVLDRRSGEAYGLVGPWFPKGWPEPELSWNLVEGAEGMGVAEEAARAVLAWLFTDRKWPSVISLVDPGNEGSVRLVEKLGARAEGTFAHDMAGEFRIWRHVPRTMAGKKLIEGLA